MANVKGLPSGLEIWYVFELVFYIYCAPGWVFIEH